MNVREDPQDTGNVSFVLREPATVVQIASTTGIVSFPIPLARETPPSGVPHARGASGTLQPGTGWPVLGTQGSAAGVGERDFTHLAMSAGRRAQGELATSTEASGARGPEATVLSRPWWRGDAPSLSNLTETQFSVDTRPIYRMEHSDDQYSERAVRHGGGKDPALRALAGKGKTIKLLGISPASGDEKKPRRLRSMKRPIPLSGEEDD